MKTATPRSKNLSIWRRKWGEIDGTPIWLYTLSRGNDLVMTVSNYGAIVQSLQVRHGGVLRDVVLGYDALVDYVHDPYYIGCVVGRYANRIDGGTINIDGINHHITTTPGGFHHHGGKKGFGKQVWTAEPFNDIDRVGIVLSYTSPHLEEGFPGNLHVSVRYELNNYRSWTIAYEIKTDMPTIANITQHTYFNLAGHDVGDIENHELETPARHILSTNARQIPTGQLMEIKDTPFEFWTRKRIGKEIDAPFDQLAAARGYDHYFVLEREHTNILKYGGCIKEPSGLVMDFHTTEPGFHFYAGNYLETFSGKKDRLYHERSGLCIETHNFPNAPNHKHFPSAIIRPGRVYQSRTVFTFKS